MTAKEHLQGFPDNPTFQYEYIFYRLCRWRKGKIAGEHYLNLPGGYFINLDPGAIWGQVLLLPRLQNRIPLVEHRLRQAQFYLRWFEPVIRVSLLRVLPCLLRWGAELKSKAHKGRILRLFRLARTTENQSADNLP